MKNSTPLVVAVFSMTCIFRGICEKCELDVVLIMAFINALSLMFVVFFLVNRAIKYVEDKINSFTIEGKDKRKKVKGVKVSLSIVTAALLTIFGVIYMFSYNATANDIISIIALGISIITEELVEGLGNVIVNKVQKEFCK